MKRYCVVFLILFVALPLSGDIIVTGFVNSKMGGGGFSFNLPMAPGCGPSSGLASGAAGIFLPSGEFEGSAGAVRSCSAEPLGPGIVGIEWESEFMGIVPVPLTTYYQDSMEYVSGSWTMQWNVNGEYGYFDGNIERYFFGGPATYDFTVSGPLADPELDFFMTFSATGPSPVPEPSAFVLLGIGLAGSWAVKLRTSI